MRKITAKKITAAFCIGLSLQPSIVFADTSPAWQNDEEAAWSWSQDLANEANSSSIAEAAECFAEQKEREAIDTLILASNDAPAGQNNDTWLPVEESKVQAFDNLTTATDKEQFIQNSLSSDQRKNFLFARQRKRIQEHLQHYNSKLQAHFTELKAEILQQPILPIQAYAPPAATQSDLDNLSASSVEKAKTAGIQANAKKMRERIALYTQSTKFGIVLNQVIGNFRDERREYDPSTSGGGRFDLPSYQPFLYNPQNGSYSDNPSPAPAWMDTLMSDLGKMQDSTFMNGLQFRPRTMKEFNINMRVLSLFHIFDRAKKPGIIPEPQVVKKKDPCEKFKKLFARQTNAKSPGSFAALNLMEIFMKQGGFENFYDVLVPSAEAAGQSYHFMNAGLSATANLTLDLSVISLKSGFNFKPQLYKAADHGWYLAFGTSKSAGTKLFGVSSETGFTKFPLRPQFGAELSYAAYTGFARELTNKATGGWEHSFEQSLNKYTMSFSGQPSLQPMLLINGEDATYTQTTSWRNSIIHLPSFFHDLSALIAGGPQNVISGFGRFIFQLVRGSFSGLEKTKFLNKIDNTTYRQNTQDQVDLLKTGSNDSGKKNSFSVFKGMGDNVVSNLGTAKKIAGAKNVSNTPNAPTIMNTWWNFDQLSFEVSYKNHSIPPDTSTTFGVAASISSTGYFYDYKVGDWEANLRLAAGVGLGVTAAVAATSYFGGEAGLWGAIVGLAAPFLASYLVADGCNYRQMRYFTMASSVMPAACLLAGFNFTDSDFGDKMKNKYYEWHP